jgi:hypothetical protein
VPNSFGGHSNTHKVCRLVSLEKEPLGIDVSRLFMRFLRRGMSESKTVKQRHLSTHKVVRRLRSKNTPLGRDVIRLLPRRLERIFQSPNMLSYALTE